MPTPPALAISEARRQFAAPDGYLDSATMGLPPDVVTAALSAAIEDWRHGRCDAVGFDTYVEGSRTRFAQMSGVSSECVAVGGQVSGFVGLVAASLPDGATVVVPEGDFTSVLFPFLAQGGRLTVRAVPLAELVDAIDSRTDVVAFSSVQSGDGALADLDGIVDAADLHGCMTVVDTTQSMGWLPIDATRFDVMVASAYKWLLSPRGTAFLVARPELAERLTAVHASWYAGEDRWDSIYGPPLRLASTTRRLDLSPAWLNWVATEAALAFLQQVGVEAIHRHDVGLANACRERLSLPATKSAIVSLSDVDQGQVEAAGLRTSIRGGRLRAAFHLHNTMDDVEALVAAVRGAG